MQGIYIYLLKILSPVVASWPDTFAGKFAICPHSCSSTHMPIISSSHSFIYYMDISNRGSTWFFVFLPMGWPITLPLVLVFMAVQLWAHKQSFPQWSRNDTTNLGVEINFLYILISLSLAATSGWWSCRRFFCSSQIRPLSETDASSSPPKTYFEIWPLGSAHVRTTQNCVGQNQDISCLYVLWVCQGLGANMNFAMETTARNIFTPHGWQRDLRIGPPP